MTMITPNALMNECGAETLKALRAPEFILPTLIMPVAFYSLFAIAIPANAQSAPYLLATFGVFAVMGPAIFGFGAGVANERERGWLNLKRAAPSPAISYIGAKLFATLLYSLAALCLIYAVAGFVGGVTLPRTTWGLLFFVHLIAAIPFVFIGLILGFTFGTNGAVAIANIVFLALSALGGLWIPMFVMPTIIQNIAIGLPSYHLGEIALTVINEKGPTLPVDHIATAIIMTFALGSLAIIAWLRQR